MSPDARQADLFSIYPEVPGARARETSRLAADAIADDVETVRDRVLNFLRDRGAAGATPDETADALKLTPFTTRPRFSELARKGLIEDTGRRRENESGRQAIIWRVKET